MAESRTQVVRKLYADGRIEEVAERWTLAELQSFVGGYIEQVKSTLAHRSLVVNEEGTLQDLPRNAAATALVAHGTLMLDGIRGNALLVKS